MGLISRKKWFSNNNKEEEGILIFLKIVSIFQKNVDFFVAKYLLFRKHD